MEDDRGIPPLEEWARHAASKDQTSFRKLVEHTQDVVYRVSLRTLGNPADADAPGAHIPLVRFALRSQHGMHERRETQEAG